MDTTYNQVSLQILFQLECLVASIKFQTNFNVIPKLNSPVSQITEIFRPQGIGGQRQGGQIQGVLNVFSLNQLVFGSAGVIKSLTVSLKLWCNENLSESFFFCVTSFLEADFIDDAMNLW